MRYVYIGTVAALAIGFLTDAKIYRMPLAIPLAMFAHVFLMGFFAWTRVGRPPMWFPHLLKTVFTRTIRRKLLRSDQGNHFFSVWISARHSSLMNEVE
jgi:hypothetical protein